MGKCVIAGCKCPQTNDRNARWFCPAWQPAIWTNPQTGEEKVINCVIEAQHMSLIATVQAASSASAEINSTRNEIAKGFECLNKLAAISVSQRLIEE